MQNLEVGQRAHGYVTGVKDYGVFIAFCSGVKGLVPLAELGLEPNQDANTHFPLGKVRLCISTATHKTLRCPGTSMRLFWQVPSVGVAV